MDGSVSEATIAAIRPWLGSPDRDAVPEVLDRGFGSLAVRFGRTVARIPGNAEVAASHARKMQTLPGPGPSPAGGRPLTRPLGAERPGTATGSAVASVARG